MMDGVQMMGKALLLMGAALLAMGALLILLGSAWRGGLPRLPGDLIWQRGEWTVYVPLATMLLLSLVLTVVLNLLVRWWRH